ncbi:MAG: hypothetical protein PHG75_02975, partial [Syntrophomonas sp.]|nr:hypothetical protein [Syntrophomonas sp.]
LFFESIRWLFFKNFSLDLVPCGTIFPVAFAPGPEYPSPVSPLSLTASRYPGFRTSSFSLFSFIRTLRAALGCAQGLYYHG